MEPAIRQTVCYVLSYYSPDYVRTKTLVAALTKIPGVTIVEARNHSTGLRRYAETLIELAKIRIRYQPDCYILGFRGIEIFWIVRLLTLGKPLYYDHLMSPYNSLVNEKAILRRESVGARLLFAYERATLQATDAVLTDTLLHKKYFEEQFDLQSEKVYAVPIGADEIFRGHSTTKESECGSASFTVLFYGSFLPLHGVDVILEAAFRLKNLPIQFLLIGGNRLDLSRFYETLDRLELDRVEHVEWVDYADLPTIIGGSDLCLGGPFGNTGQGQRVVTGKTVQCLAMSKPTVVGEIEENYGFVDKENCLLVPQADPDALSEAIMWAFEHQDELYTIGTKGRALYEEQFSTIRISRKLRCLLAK